MTDKKDDPTDQSMTAADFLQGSEKFNTYLERIRFETAEDRRKEKAKFERKMMIGSFVRMGLWAAAGYFVMRMVKEANKRAREDAVEHS